MQQAWRTRKEGEVAKLRRLWAVASPGHPSAPTVAEHYRHLLWRLREKHLYHAVRRAEINRQGLWLMALAEEAMKREAETC